MNWNPMRWFRGERKGDDFIPEGLTFRLLPGSTVIAGDRRQYIHKVGDFLDSSLAMAPILWLQRAVLRAPLVIERETREGEWDEIDHPFLALWERPSDGFTADMLMQALLRDLITDGNGYLLPEVNRSGRPVGIVYAPIGSIEPEWPHDGSTFISHYAYSPGGAAAPIDIPPEDVVHLREGVNPRNRRKGLSPLYPAIREIWLDMEATTYEASVLGNNGVPGLIVGPDGDATLSPEEQKALKEYLQQEIRGEGRGSVVVASGKYKMDRLAWNPKEMVMNTIRDMPEERVCALLGIPPAVVGYESALETARAAATVKETLKLAWENGVIPRLQILEAGIDQMLRGYGERGNIRARFDTSAIPALQEDEDRLHERAASGVRGGYLTVESAQRMIGEEPEAGSDVYLRPFATVEVPVGGQRPERETASARNPERKETPAERRISESAPRRDPSAAQRTFIRRLESGEQRMVPLFAQRLEEFFIREIREPVARAARPVIERELSKQFAADKLIAGEIILDAGLVAMPEVWADQLRTIYAEVAEDTASALAPLGLATNLPDYVARAIVAVGGRRAGLIDLVSQTRDELFRILTETRAEGLGAEATMRRIRDTVGSGPWSSPTIRGRVIARTETKYAQNRSVLLSSRDQGATQFMVFDGRLPSSDELCIGLHGAIVSAEEAEQLTEDEHPNGTRSLTPHFGE